MPSCPSELPHFPTLPRPLSGWPALAWAAPLAVMMLSGCFGGGDDETIPSPDVAVAQGCTALKGSTVAASNIGVGSSQPGLASSGATVADAVLVAASAPTPTYCRVTGSIAAASAGARAINFQVNLPANWNGKALQYGGAGLNGSVVTGLASLPNASAADATPLQRGYATLGSDSGHSSPSPVIGTFAQDDESLVNFAYAQMKKTRDVAASLARTLYQTPIGRTYFVGSSEGGREALTVAQRFPNDYAGVIAAVPVIQYSALQLNGNRITKVLAQPGGALDLAAVTLLHTTTLAKCDAADGLVDNIIGNTFACSLTSLELEALACSNHGAPCLSGAQIDSVNAIHGALTLGFSLAHGNTSYFPFQWGGELSVLSSAPVGGVDVWLSSPTALGPLIGTSFVQNFIARDAALDPLTFDPAAYQARIQAVSPLVDSDNAPAMASYLSGGGKVIVRESGADYAHSPKATIDFVQRVQTANPSAAATGLRFYFNPMVDHTSVGVQPNDVDLLTQLERWVEQGQVPADQLTVSRASTGQTRLMCRYPNYPRYNGSGSTNAASSFTCTAPGP